jgi:hypothetical protein
LSTAGGGIGMRSSFSTVCQEHLLQIV